MHNKHFIFESECTFSPICWRKVTADSLAPETSGSNPVIYVLCSYFTPFIALPHLFWYSTDECL